MEAYRALWRKNRRRPLWKEVAERMAVGVRTLLIARRYFGVDEKEITLDLDE